ncbi:DEAD/DEAH box helicase [Luteococcus sp. Sow4_B9]|uniref:DEAD/DEAH box helicase n=1 Tax=Luteococcus sp. Sow4_B9 TaxID=3438792 RepID=UPI003F96C016
MAAQQYPSWVREVTDEQLVASFGAPTFFRGSDYAKQGRVDKVTIASEKAVSAQVTGTGHSPYYVLVTWNGTRASNTCTCPVRQDCKHGVALVQHLRTSSDRLEIPRWQREMTRILGTSQQDQGGTPLGIQYTLLLHDVELRPVYWGARNTWARGQLTWDRIDIPPVIPRGPVHDPAHMRALGRIQRAATEARRTRWGYAAARASHLLLSELGHDGWRLIQEAVHAGVELVPAKESKAVTFRGPELTLGTRLTSDDEGLRLERTLLLDGESVRPVNMLGVPPHGALLPGENGNRIAVGFTEPLDEHGQALVHLTQVEIPAQDVGQFALDYLPRLRRVTTVAQAPDLELPVARPPQLLVQLSQSPSEQEVAATLSLGFRYSFTGAASSVDVTASSGRSFASRDAIAEQAFRPLVDELLGAPSKISEQLPATKELVGKPLLELWQRLDALRDRDDVIVEVWEDAPRYLELDEAPEIRLEVGENPGRDWFDLEVQVSVGENRIPLPDLLRALSAGDDHLVLDSGEWFALDHPELDRLRELLSEARLLTDPDSDGSVLRLRPENAGWWEELVELGVVARENQAWTQISSRLLSADGAPELAAPGNLRAELRGYQLTGLRWMDFLRSVGLGGILADDMGLGKTLQALALVCSLQERELLDGPVLVVAPSSVVGAWAEQAERFAPTLRVANLAETSRKRGIPVAQAIEGADVVLTSYAVARLDVEEFEQVSWQLVLLDEAQFVKNRQSRTYLAMRRIPARSRFALSGTPLENNLMDLWTLLSLTAPGVFPDSKAFTDDYRKPIEEGGEVGAAQLAQLLRRLKPVLMRRTKELVAPELPPRQEQVVPVELNQEHRRVYDRQLNRERQRVMGLVGDMQKNRMTILRSLTRLRQLSLAPGLVDKENAAIESSKIEVLVELMADVVAGGHRALVFSQFTGFLGMVRDRLNAEGIETVYLDGRTRNRQARVDEFRDGTAPAFLISLKAGGFGLTLTEADYVFMLDPWWNPAAEAQAVDRAHRIGQDKPVMVYRLVATGTIEAKVLALQERKRELFNQVVDSGDGAVGAALSADDIRGLLEF